MGYFIQLYVCACYAVMLVFATGLFMSQNGLTRMDVVMLVMAPFSMPMMVATKLASSIGDPEEFVIKGNDDETDFD